ncbi:hypothetical protein P886_0201 [Alteromonadaceae bacterium 2753L.S.0a.02]|nr:hypothetical protein P886_0201 [Alteromonadaceae bacterium 2753L.S.0a.02]
MNKLIYICGVLFGAACNAGVSAEEVTKDITIKTLHPIAEVRPAYTPSQNITRIYFKETDGWSKDVGCRNGEADLKSTDEHLLSILLMAWATNKSIKVAVDSALKVDNAVCTITALVVQ